jgi:hypothetical protein
MSVGFRSANFVGFRSAKADNAALRVVCSAGAR